MTKLWERGGLDLPSGTENRFMGEWGLLRPARCYFIDVQTFFPLHGKRTLSKAGQKKKFKILAKRAAR